MDKKLKTALALSAFVAVATPTFAQEDYLVGLIAGTTGAYGAVGIAVVNGAQMAVDEINAAGGVNGHKLVLDANNDDASATLSGQHYARLLSDGAIVIAGSPDTGPTTAQLAERYQFPTIGVVDDGGLTIYTEGPDGPPNEWAWSFGLNTFAWGEKIGEHALSHCPDGQLAVLHDPSTYGQGGLYGIQIAYNKAGKEVAMDHTITENWSTGATAGLMPEVEAIKAAGLKCVVVWLTPQDQAAFAQDLQTVGYDVIMYGNDVTNADDTFSSLAGELGDGLITAALTTELFPNERLQAWRDEYRTRFGLEPSPFAAGSYDSMMMLKQVLEDVGSTDPEALKNGFNSVQNFDGLTGTLGFSEQDHLTINAEQITLVEYDAASDSWVELKD
ncbi:MAG: ABC transporter substrate-binding protein [Hyphomicrobiaceae bacterium]|nr:ABC transporter substrate-binding protein [Hyphomicrobiaceae bacterium]MCC0025244.1 ABC transporter substrate-binding protein [Hyphomicrobiaceae bacterium]